MGRRCDESGVQGRRGGGGARNIAEIPNSSWYDHSAPTLQEKWGEIMQIHVCSFPSVLHIRGKRGKKPMNAVA